MLTIHDSNVNLIFKQQTKYFVLRIISVDSKRTLHDG